MTSNWKRAGAALAMLVAAPAVQAQVGQPTQPLPPPGAAPVSAPTAQSAPTAPQAAPAAPQAAPAASVPASYVIGVGDTIRIGVASRADFDVTVTIPNDGSIQLPFIGSVRALGQRPEQLRDEVRDKLRTGGYFANPAVNVAIITFASRYVTVLGQVGTPGVISIDREYRLSEILARAGGRADTGGDTVTVTREDGSSTTFDLTQIATGGPAQDPVIQAGEKVFVPLASTFFIYGQVTRPGEYPIKPGMTLRMALASGGGLTALGSERRIKLIRGGNEMKRASLDEVIRPEDVVVIGERFF